MVTTLNRRAYETLISEDIEWLIKQPRTLERDHIEHVLRDSPRRMYPPAHTLQKLQKIRTAYWAWRMRVRWHYRYTTSLSSKWKSGHNVGCVLFAPDDVCICAQSIIDAKRRIYAQQKGKTS